MQYIKQKRQAEEVDLFSDDEVEEGTQPISREDYERLIKYLEKKNPPEIWSAWHKRHVSAWLQPP